METVDCYTQKVMGIRDKVTGKLFPFPPRWDMENLRWDRSTLHDIYALVNLNPLLELCIVEVKVTVETTGVFDTITSKSNGELQAPIGNVYRPV